MLKWMDISFIDGRLGKDGSQNTSFLIWFITMALVATILIGLVCYYFYQFQKTKAKAKIIGWSMLGAFFALEGVATLCWILGLVFFCEAEQIFDTPTIAQNTIIVLLVIGFLALFVGMLLMWVFLPKFAIALTDSKIVYLGESVAYDRIQGIIVDNKKQAIYVNYQQTKRTFKRQKFSLKSVEGQFMLAHAKDTGHESIVGNEDHYYRSLTLDNQKTKPVQNSENDKK